MLYGLQIVDEGHEDEAHIFKSSTNKSDLLDEVYAFAKLSAKVYGRRLEKVEGISNKPEFKGQVLNRWDCYQYTQPLGITLQIIVMEM